MTQDDRVGLGTVKKTQGYRRKGRMKERALPFNDVPTIVITAGREALDRAGQKIARNRIQGHAITGDKNTGLSGGPEVCQTTAAPEFPLDRKGGIHFANRAICSDRQETPTGAARTVSDRKIISRNANIEKRSTEFGCQIADFAIIAQMLVKTSGDIQAGAKCRQHIPDNAIRHIATFIREAQDQSFGSRRYSFFEVHFRQAESLAMPI
jgi:hypothetical protein